MAPERIPKVSPKLTKQIAFLSLIYISATLTLQYTSLITVEGTILNTGKDIYLAIAGISATLAGFVIAGMAVLSTILPKKEFKESKIKLYYSQIYNSFHYSAIMLGSSIIFGILGAIYPKDNIISECIFFVTIYIFTSCAIFIYSTIDIMRSLLDIDASGNLTPDQSEAPIETTDAPTVSNGSLY